MWSEGVGGEQEGESKVFKGEGAPPLEVTGDEPLLPPVKDKSVSE